MTSNKSRTNTNKLKLNNAEYIEKYIIIYPDMNIPRHLEGLFKSFMQSLNILIGGNTTLNYHILPLQNCSIYIPIRRYTQEDYNISDNEYILCNIDKIQKFFEEFDIMNANKDFLYLYRSIETCIRVLNKKTIQEIFKIMNKDINYVDTLHFQKIEIEFPKIKETKLIDDSMIIQYIDPYITDYGIMVDLSKKFSEIGYCYNALHIYEHFMTYGWRDLDHLNQDHINGYTIINGISCIYTILTTIESVNQYLMEYFKFATNSRKIEFWNKNKEMIERETARTISESYDVRDYSSYTRNDPSSYKICYDNKIFCKWSQEPISLIIITDKELSINLEVINSLLINSLSKEDKITIDKPLFNSIPTECFIDKYYRRIIKLSSDEIIKRLLDNKHNRTIIYGLDCAIVFENNIEVNYNHRMHLLLFLKRKINNKEIEKLLRNDITVPSCSVLFNF